MLRCLYYSINITTIESKEDFRKNFSCFSTKTNNKKTVAPSSSSNFSVNLIC